MAMAEKRDVDLAPNTGFKDPHVFPYIVKGFRTRDQDLVYESRRSDLDAQQSVERLRAQGYDCYVFQATLIKEALA